MTSPTFDSFYEGAVRNWRFSLVMCCENWQYNTCEVCSDVSKKFWWNTEVFKPVTSSTCVILDKNGQFSVLRFCVYTSKMRHHINVTRNNNACLSIAINMSNEYFNIKAAKVETTLKMGAILPM